MSVDVSIVAAAAGGDRTAFGHLVDQYRSVVCAIALSTTRDAGLTEDISQDVFLSAWRALPSLRDPERFPAWISRLARNRSRELLRSGRRYADRVMLDGDRVDRAAAPETPLDDRSALRAALADLSESDREVLVLYYLVGTSVRQTAKLLGLSDAAVKQRLSRARKRLRERVEDVESGVSRHVSSAALTTTILAAITGVPQQARASEGRTSPFVLTGAVLLVLVGGIAITWTSSAPEPQASTQTEARGVSPSVSARARARRRTALWLPPTPDKPTVELSVPVGEPDRLLRNFAAFPAFSASLWFPRPGEGPLPSDAAATALQAQLDHEHEHGIQLLDPAHDELRRLAAQEEYLEIDVDEILEDPWRGIVALELLRRDELQRFFDAAANKDGVIFYDDRDTPLPERDLAPLARAADALATAHAGTPVGRYAALYQVYVVTETGSGGPDTLDRLVALATDVDDVLALAALSALPEALLHAEAHLTAEDLTQIRHRVDGLADHQGRADVVLAMTEQAVAHGDPDDLAAWRDIVTEALVAACGVVPSRQCTMYEQELPVILGQLADRTDRAPQSWAEGLVVAAHRCAGGLASLGDTTMVGHGTYDGRWRWDRFEPENDLTTCVTTAAVDGPRPPLGARVDLTLTWRGD